MTIRLAATALLLFILPQSALSQSHFTTEPQQITTPEEALALSREVKEFLRSSYGLEPTSNNTQWTEEPGKEHYLIVIAVPPFSLFPHYGYADRDIYNCSSKKFCEELGKGLVEVLRENNRVTYTRIEPQVEYEDVKLSWSDVDRATHDLIERFLIHEDLHFHVDLLYGLEESFVTFLSSIFTYEFCSKKGWQSCQTQALKGLGKLLEEAVYYRALYTALSHYWQQDVSDEDKIAVWPWPNRDEVNEAQITDDLSYFFYIPALFRIWSQYRGDNRKLFAFIKELYGLSEEEIAERLNAETR